MVQRRACRCWCQPRPKQACVLLGTRWPKLKLSSPKPRSCLLCHGSPIYGEAEWSTEFGAVYTHERHVIDDRACSPHGLDGIASFRAWFELIGPNFEWISVRSRPIDNQELICVYIQIRRATELQFRCGLDYWTLSETLFRIKDIKIWAKDQARCKDQKNYKGSLENL